MANPYAGKAGSTSAAKVKALTGKSTKGHVFDGSPIRKADGGSVKPIEMLGPPKPSDRIGRIVAGRTSSHEGLKHAMESLKIRPPEGKKDGGAVAKARGGAVKGKTNITINIGKSGGEKQPVPVPVPIPAGGPPPGPPPMAPPPPVPMPGPMMRKSGGRVKMTAGAETGEGRLQKAKAYRRG